MALVYPNSAIQIKILVYFFYPQGMPCIAYSLWFIFFLIYHLYIQKTSSFFKIQFKCLQFPKAFLQQLEKMFSPSLMPHNTLSLPLSGLTTFCFQLLLHWPFSPARWSVPIFYTSKEGAEKSRVCSGRSGKAHFWTSQT